MYEVDIVIPAYNHLNLTQQVIKNIEETQKDVNYQLIIINDGSSDWTKERLDNNKKDNWMVVHQANQWTNWAWNRWVELATADYIAIFNNDIIIPEWTLKKMMEWFTDKVWMVQTRSTTLKTTARWDKPFYFSNHIQGRCYMINQEAKKWLYPIDKRLRIFWWDNWLFFKMIYLWYKLKTIHDVVIHHMESQTVHPTINLDWPVFMSIAKEEWWYVLPLEVKKNNFTEDLVFGY